MHMRSVHGAPPLVLLLLHHLHHHHSMLTAQYSQHRSGSVGWLVGQVDYVKGVCVWQVDGHPQQHRKCKRKQNSSS